MGEEGEDTSWKIFMERIRRGSGRSSRHNPSSLIQFKSEAKSMVHFLNKGGGGGGYIGEELHGEERGQEWSDARITGDDASWRQMRRGRERGEEEEGPCSRTGIRVGCQPCWHPTVSQGR
jgi:hypothetical protein